MKRPKNLLKDSSGWLLLTGNYGCGKTHLAAAIANEAMAKRTRLYFAIVPDLLDALRATFDPNSEEKYDDRFEMIRNVPSVDIGRFRYRKYQTLGAGKTLPDY